MYFNGMFNAEKIDESVDYAVFDDLIGGFEFFKNYKAWLGQQKEFEVTDKYKKKRTVHWGKPTIMCMNESPFSYGIDHDWLMGNCDVIEIKECMLSILPPNSDSQSA